MIYFERLNTSLPLFSRFDHLLANVGNFEIQWRGCVDDIVEWYFRLLKDAIEWDFAGEV